MPDERRPKKDADDGPPNPRADRPSEHEDPEPENTLTDDEMRTFEDRVLHHQDEEEKPDLPIPIPPPD